VRCARPILKKQLVHFRPVIKEMKID